MRVGDLRRQLARDVEAEVREFAPVHDERRTLDLRQQRRHIGVLLRCPRSVALLRSHAGAHVLRQPVCRFALRPAEYRVRERLSEHLPVEVAQPRVDLGLCAVVGLFVLREAAPEHEVRHALRMLGGVRDRHGARVIAAEEREPF